MINIIHQIAFSGDDLNGYIPPNTDNLKEFFPDAKYHLWDLPQFKKLLIDDGATDVLDAINNIRPYAFKADIARYYIIYKTGGWYIDQNNYFTMSPSTAKIDNKSFVGFAESQMTSGSPWAVQNSLFYAHPQHEVMEKAVQKCVQNVQEQYYGFKVTCPTGPNVLGSAVAEQRLVSGHTQVFGQWLYWVKDRPRGFYLPKMNLSNPGINPFEGLKQPLALYKPYAELEHPAGESGIPGGNSHWTMWHNKEVY